MVQILEKLEVPLFEKQVVFLEKQRSYMSLITTVNAKAKSAEDQG